MWHSPGKVQSHTAAYFPFALTSFSLQSSSIQVANLACSISNNEEGVKLVRMAATQIDSLCPQVSLIHFVSTADILDLVHSSLHDTHSLPCHFSSPWKVLPISHGPFQVLPFSKRTANCSSLSKITVVIIVFSTPIDFFYLSWIVISTLHIYSLCLCHKIICLYVENKSYISAPSVLKRLGSIYTFGNLYLKKRRANKD